MGNVEACFSFSKSKLEQCYYQETFFETTGRFLSKNYKNSVYSKHEEPIKSQL